MWFSEKQPDQPGWYWYMDHIRVPEIVEVMPAANMAHAYIRSATAKIPDRVDATDGALWAGPIPEPLNLGRELIAPRSKRHRPLHVHIQCAWCEKAMAYGLKPPEEGISHGICRDCEQTQRIHMSL